MTQSDHGGVFGKAMPAEAPPPLAPTGGQSSQTGRTFSLSGGFLRVDFITERLQMHSDIGLATSKYIQNVALFLAQSG